MVEIMLANAWNYVQMKLIFDLSTAELKLPSAYQSS